MNHQVTYPSKIVNCFRLAIVLIFAAPHVYGQSDSLIPYLYLAEMGDNNNDGTQSFPFSVVLSQRIDAFAAGYHVGVLNRNPANYGATGSGNNKHAYLHTLKNSNAQVIEIRATDKFGNVYTQREIISSLTSAGTYP